MATSATDDDKGNHLYANPSLPNDVEGHTTEDSKLEEIFQPQNYPRLYDLIIEQRKKPRTPIPLSIVVKMLYSVWIQIPAMGSLTPFVILVEFIEVCFNLFLHSRAIYPTSFFIPTAFFGIPVLKCRHPILGGYLQTILASIGELIKLNSVYALAIVKYEKESKDPMEKLSFFVKSVENPMLPLSMERLLFIKAKLSALVLKLFDDVPCKTNTSSSVATNFYVLVKVKDETPDMKQLLSPVALWYAPIGYSSANDAIGAPLISKMPLSESSLKSEIEIDLSLESSQ